uniref:Uncharacterized protein n=1 Tax=Vespula pensylvanica TaxID=30213 RepID=A0A834P7M3_VESPE|nr:hypothetical protein H0235_004651 [Vespula pensylvanica]
MEIAESESYTKLRGTLERQIRFYVKDNEKYASSGEKLVEKEVVQERGALRSPGVREISSANSVGRKMFVAEIRGMTSGPHCFPR